MNTLSFQNKRFTFAALSKIVIIIRYKIKKELIKLNSSCVCIALGLIKC